MALCCVQYGALIPLSRSIRPRVARTSERAGHNESSRSYSQATTRAGHNERMLTRTVHCVLQTCSLCSRSHHQAEAAAISSAGAHALPDSTLCALNLLSFLSARADTAADGSHTFDLAPPPTGARPVECRVEPNPFSQAAIPDTHPPTRSAFPRFAATSPTEETLHGRALSRGARV
eukprot:42178-Rhodomonas_salina.1